MAINGLQKFSLVDYPGKLSCVVFFGHCNFRCPFCHNPSLVFDPGSQGRIALPELADFFARRRGKLEGVVFSGGEPTLQPELAAAAGLAREAGFAIRLDTNASRPATVAALHRAGLLDSLGIDYKAPAAKYLQVCGGEDPDIPAKVRRTIEFALRNGIELEIRTTVHRALLGETDLRQMRDELAALGVKTWILQQFHAAELIDDELNTLPTFSDSDLLAVARSLGSGVSVRGLAASGREQ
ncbi:MAG: anaerobic ribonucleoside-triphosphate reductase activating protein [Victivallaceae bacterium]